MKSIFKVLTSLVISFAMVFSITVMPTSAASKSIQKQQLNSDNFNSLSLNNAKYISELKNTNENSISKSIIDNYSKLLSSTSRKVLKNYVNNKAVSDAASTESDTQDTPTIYNLSSPYLSYSSSLTPTSTQNYFTFETSEDKYIAIGLISDNANYGALLYKYDSASDNYVSQNFYVTSGNANILSDLPAGQYLLAVISTDTVGDNYIIQMNALNPANPLNTYYLTFSNMVFGYKNSIYSNGNIIYANGESNGSALKWERYQNFGGGTSYNNIGQILDLVKVDMSKPIKHVKNYKTSYASSADALFIPIGAGTYWSFTQRLYQDNQTTYYSTTDCIGLNTPTDLTEEDIQTAPGYVVFDLATCKSVDFLCDRNYDFGQLNDSASYVEIVD